MVRISWRKCDVQETIYEKVFIVTEVRRCGVKDEKRVLFMLSSLPEQHSWFFYLMCDVQETMNVEAFYGDGSP